MWKREATLREILEFLKDTYCGTIGVEYMYMTDMPQKRWVQERLESIRSTPQYDAEFKKHILERLTAAETLEKYMHTRYVGQKRFSGEGGESIIPQLDLLLQRAGKAGVQELVIGMAHRGRLNVLVNTHGQDAQGPLRGVRRQARQPRPAGGRRQIPHAASRRTS